MIGDSGSGKSQISKMIERISKKVDEKLTKVLENSGYEFRVESFYGATGTLAGFLGEATSRYGRCNISVDEQAVIARMMEIDENRKWYFSDIFEIRVCHFRHKCHRRHDRVFQDD